MTTEATPQAPENFDAASVVTRIEALVAEGVPADQVTPERVLGLSPEEVARLAVPADRGPSEAGERWVSSPRGQSGGRFAWADGLAALRTMRRVPGEIAAAIRDEATRRGWAIALTHESELRYDHAGFRRYLQHAPVGWVTLMVRAHLDGDPVRMGRHTVYADLPERAIARPPWQDVMLDGERVARIAPHPSGQGGLLVWLLVNPFQGRTLRGNPAGLSSRQVPDRMRILARILDEIAPSVGEHAWTYAPERPEDAVLREAIDMVRAVQAMSAGRVQAHQHAITQAESALQNADARAEQLRNELIIHLRTTEQQRMLLEDLRARIPERQNAEAIASLEAVRRIRSLGPVRQARIVPMGNGFGLEVELHRYIIQSRTPAAARHALPALAFTLRLDTDRLVIAWRMNGSASPHPHISGAGATCWGDAQVPLAEAFARRDWLTVVVLITGWVTQHNPRSEYTEIRRFPTTDQPAGWIIPSNEETTNAA